MHTASRGPSSARACGKQCTFPVVHGQQERFGKKTETSCDPQTGTVIYKHLYLQLQERERERELQSAQSQPYQVLSCAALPLAIISLRGHVISVARTQPAFANRDDGVPEDGGSQHEIEHDHRGREGLEVRAPLWKARRCHSCQPQSNSSLHARRRSTTCLRTGASNAPGYIVHQAAGHCHAILIAT